MFRAGLLLALLSSLLWGDTASSSFPAPSPTDGDGYGDGDGDSDGDGNDGPILKAMSFNVRWNNEGDGSNRWDVRFPYVIEEVLRWKPDVIGFQEVLQDQRELLEDRLGGDYGRYTFRGIGRDDGMESGEQTTVAWLTERFTEVETGHFWLSETPDVPSLGWDAVCCNRMVTWTVLADRLDEDREFMFVNTHWDHQGRIAREESAMLVRRFVLERFGQERVVLVGDFNTPGGSAPHQILVPDLFQDTFRTAYPEPFPSPSERTYHSFVGPSCFFCIPFRIDWVLATNDYGVLEAAIQNATNYDGRYPSDHYAVTATLKPAPPLQPSPSPMRPGGKKGKKDPKAGKRGKQRKADHEDGEERAR